MVSPKLQAKIATLKQGEMGYKVAWRDWKLIVAKENLLWMYMWNN